MIVSSKGQIVIPKKYRDRLEIEPGMEVQVRIRGQFLMVEIDTDIQADIEFLESIAGNLGENDLEIPMMTDILDDLLKQQFYKENDILTDRINRESLVIRGADAIINQTIKILAGAGRHWLEGNYVDTLREFADSLDLDFPALTSKYVQTLKNMMPGGDLSMIEMMGGEIPFTMAVSTTLTHFREKIGDIVTERLIKRAEEKGFVEKYGEDKIEEMVTSALAERHSMLMNLRTLREMARTSVKFVGARQFHLRSEQMFDEFEDADSPEKLKRKYKREERRKRRKLQEVEEPSMPDMNVADEGESLKSSTKPPSSKITYEDEDELTDMSDEEEEEMEFEMPDIPDASDV